jgi:hypothetical protein
LLHGRFGSKEALWHATADWAFRPLALRLATAFDPTVLAPRRIESVIMPSEPALQMQTNTKAPDRGGAVQAKLP